jgi:hypothetical protein
MKRGFHGRKKWQTLLLGLLGEDTGNKTVHHIQHNFGSIGGFSSIRMDGIPIERVWKGLAELKKKQVICAR